MRSALLLVCLDDLTLVCLRIMAPKRACRLIALDDKEFFGGMFFAR